MKVSQIKYVKSQIGLRRVYFFVSQVNGVNVEGLRHSEVVALIKTGGEEIQLLMVDQETDELFRRLGITPTSHHINGHITD